MASDRRDIADVVIVGGGASGLAAGVVVGQLSSGLRVVLVEGGDRPGAKLLLAGGGRCNVTNAAVRAQDYHGGSSNVVRRVLKAWPVARTVEWFDQLGVALREEAGGKLFPVRGRARAVVDALVGELGRVGVEVRTGWRVTAIERADDSLVVRTSRGDVTADAVLLAAGGQSYPKTGSDGSGYALAAALGHSVVPTTPALVPLVLGGSFHTSLSGISQDVTLTVHAVGAKPVRYSGSMLWTHFGVSGPVVLDASRHWHRAALAGEAVRVAVNFLAGDEFASAERRLMPDGPGGGKTLAKTLSAWVPARVAAVLLTARAIDGQTTLTQLSREHRRALAHALVDWPLSVTGSRGWGHAEVTAGGVALTEVDPRTMASRCCDRLYLAGEVLDVDGRVGGYNLQWAWSSAGVAAEAIVKQLGQSR